jgi:hypothetical protein
MPTALKWFLLVFLLAMPVSAQTTTPVPPTLSNFELQLNQTGTLLVRNYEPIIDLKDIYDSPLKLNCASLEFPNSKKPPVGGFQLRFGKGGIPGFIDYDEISGFVAAFDYLSTLSKTDASEGRQAEYLSRGGVGVALFLSDKGWNVSVDINNRYNVFFTDPVRILGQLKSAFQKGLSCLANHGVK